MKFFFNQIALGRVAGPARKSLPWLLLAAAILLFMQFITTTRQQNNVLNNLEKLKSSGEIVTLDEWQAQPFHCPPQSVSLDQCQLLSSSDFRVVLPKTSALFSALKREIKKDSLPINGARLKYRLRINEIDWIKLEKHKNTLLFSLAIPRTSQDLLFVYADPAGATQHGGRGVNVVASFGRNELLKNPEFTLDLIAPSYVEKFGPQTLPIALMTPSRTTPFFNLIHQMQASSLPATLISLLLPVLAAAMAVILDGSKVMFHISGYALMRGLRSLFAESFNQMDGRGDLMLGTPNSSGTKFLIVLVTSASIAWLLYVVRELIQTPRAPQSSGRNRLLGHLIPAGLFFAAALLLPSSLLGTSQLERVADLIAGVLILVFALFSLIQFFKAPAARMQSSLTLNLEEQHTLFNPVHFYLTRTALISTAVLLSTTASFQDLRSSFSGILHYDPLDWRQAILTPVLLLSAVLGVGSVTQKMNQYASLMRTRVENLMNSSRRLASAPKNIVAVTEAIKVIQEEVNSLKFKSIEIILPDTKTKSIHEFAIDKSQTLDDLQTREPKRREGSHPAQDQDAVILSGHFLTLQLFQDSRWLGTVSWECDSPVYLTNEELHFINVTSQTLCLTLDNLNAIDELRRADKLKDDFLANTSHELRTPLHGIIGIAESLLNLRELGLSNRIKDNLNLITISARRLTNLVNDLLDFSQIKQRELKLKPVQVELRPMIQLIFALNRPMLDKKPIELINEVSQELPPLHCDESRTHQILQNLIGNAIKFTHNGFIKVTATAEGRFAKISIIDTGIGIEPEKTQKIFNSFEQADGSINRLYGGTGLGLTISKHLTELHGGKITIESKAGTGSTFSVFLPIANADSAFEPYQQTQFANNDSLSRPRLLEDEKQWWEPSPSTAARVTGKLIPNGRHQFKVLVVDDDAVNRRILENHLTAENYQVLVADDGLSALESVRQNQPDLILLDLMMPKISGLDVLTQIRVTHSTSDLPVIILTAKNQASDLVACFAAGANDFLMKPFSHQELLARIRNHLHMSRIYGAYSRFIPNDFLSLLGRESIVDVRLGDQILKEMSVLFLDIREFSRLSERMSPEENFNFLNSYYATVNPIIKKNFGFIDKYIGDSVMALFANKTDDALLSAVELIRQLDDYNNRRKSEFQAPINVGIGVHHGPLMLGTLGNEQRMEGTVISESVNLAARLETITKIFSVSIISSQETLQLARNSSQFQSRSLGRIRPHGFSKSISIVEIFNADTAHIRDLKLKTLEQHESSLKSFQLQNWDAAIDGWKYVLDQNPADTVAARYLDRAVRYKLSPPASDWDGTFELRSR